MLLGKIEGKRRRGRQTIKCLDSITNSMDMNLSKLQEIVKDGGAWWASVYGVSQSRTQLKRLSSGNWENHSFDYMDFCQQSDVSAF